MSRLLGVRLCHQGMNLCVNVPEESVGICKVKHHSGQTEDGGKKKKTLSQWVHCLWFKPDNWMLGWGTNKIDQDLSTMIRTHSHA